MAGDFLLDLTHAQLQASLRQLARAFRFNHLLVTPHSLWRGGATHLLKRGASLGKIAETRYWSRQKTCRQYRVSALSNLTEGEDLATDLLLQVISHKQTEISNTWFLQAGG